MNAFCFNLNMSMPTEQLKIKTFKTRAGRNRVMLPE